MAQLQQNVSLKSHNSFNIDATARWWLKITDESLAVEFLMDNMHAPESLFILGGGSNILLIDHLHAVVLKNEISGIEVISESEEDVLIRIGAGENWHGLVMYCINRGWGGIENLSLIPGSVGAAPIQNIGAYGVELKDVFDSLEAIHLKTGNIHVFSKEECRFGYRDSVFKRELKGQYMITRVYLRLSKYPELNTSYGIIIERLKVKNAKIGIREVGEVICNIRREKLPDPSLVGNAGSFFKNPVVSDERFNELIKDYPAMPYYPEPGDKVKIPAAWLIEQCGWKGKRFGNYGVYPRQALVLVNYGGASGEEIFVLSERIRTSVENTFGIALEREVQVVP